MNITEFFEEGMKRAHEATRPKPLFDKEAAREKFISEYPGMSHWERNQFKRAQREEEKRNKYSIEQEKKKEIAAAKEYARKKLSDDIMLLRKEGVSYEDIAAYYGTSRQNIHMKIRNHPAFSPIKRIKREWIPKECGTCEVSFYTKMEGRKYCSIYCGNIGKKKPPEEIKKNLLLKKKQYYHNVLKLRPDWKDKVKKYQENTMKKRLADPAYDAHVKKLDREATDRWMKKSIEKDAALQTVLKELCK